MIKRQVSGKLAAVCIGVSLVFQVNLTSFALEYSNGNSIEYTTSYELTHKEQEIIALLNSIEIQDFNISTLENLESKVNSLDLHSSTNIKIASYIVKTLSSKITQDHSSDIFQKAFNMESILVRYLMDIQNRDGSWKSYSFNNAQGTDETRLVLNSLLSYMEANKDRNGRINIDNAEELSNSLDNSLKYLALQSLSNLSPTNDKHDLTKTNSPTLQSSPYYTGSLDNNSTVINMGSAFNNSFNNSSLGSQSNPNGPTHINNEVKIDNSVTTNYITNNGQDIDDSDLRSIRKNIKNIRDSLDDLDSEGEKINNYNTTTTEGDTYNTTNNNETINNGDDISDLKNFLSQLLGGQKEKYSNSNDDGSPDYSSDVENILDLEGETDENGNVDLSQLATKEDLNKLAKFIHDSNTAKQESQPKIPKEAAIAASALGIGLILKKIALKLGGN